MKRIVLGSLVVIIGCLAAGWALNGLPEGPNGNHPKYWVEIDNAFGLNQGGDLKIAGVRAGQITDIELDQRTLHAKVQFRVDKTGFGSLRSDVHCDVRPQSLIGEYFLDCNPGTAKQVVKPGSVIPVTHTTSTIAPDLVNDIMRLPQREGLRLIVAELGAGVAGNAANLQAAIRRASPALQQLDRVLAILAQQSHVINDLNVQADQVLQALADNKRDVARWVVDARNISRDSAERRVDIARGFHRLPRFLEVLKPTMAALGRTADAQRPALHNLDVASGQLRQFFLNLGPFANASRPAFRALGQASRTGSRAVVDATKPVQQLNTFAKPTPELAKNLAIVLRYLDNRGNASEDDPRASIQQGVKGPSGYSGLEALLQYVMDQTTAINIFDGNFHILDVAAFDGGPCDQYADVARLKANYAALKDCEIVGGPETPGVFTPDPSASLGPYPPQPAPVGGASTRASFAKASSGAARAAAQTAGGQGSPSGAQGGSGSGGSGSGSSGSASPLGAVHVPGVNAAVPQVPKTPALPRGGSASGTGTEPAPGSADSTRLLDYLLGR